MNRRLAAVLTILLLTACQKSRSDRFDYSQADTTPVSGGTFVEASIGDASFLNPVLSSDSASNDINNLVFNGLVKYDKNIQLTGDLAERWDVADGGKTLTFYLRKNVQWHDGKPFTAEDVLFTFQRLIDPKTRTPFSVDFLQVEKAEVLSPYVFRVRYKRPFAPAVESWGMGIIPKHIFENTDINTNPANKNPIGTGPYIFHSWKTDEKIEIRANPNYFEDRPYLDRYVYRIIPDLSVQFLELRQGTLSMMAPTPDQYNGYEEFFLDYDKYKYPAFRYDYIAFNLKSPFFEDKRVRTALAHGINIQEIIAGVYQGLAVQATGPFPQASWAFNKEVQPIAYDVEKAKSLLKEAGWTDSDGDGFLDKGGQKFAFTLILNQGNTVRESIAQIAQNNLKALGIDVTVRILEWSVFIHKYIDEREFEACVLGWNLSRDPDCTSIWHSSEIGKAKYNFVGYKNPEVDRLLVEGRETFNLASREKIYRRIHALIADDVPYIFLVNPMSLPVVHKKLRGVELAPAGLAWNFNEWYIPKAWQNQSRLAAQ